MTNGEDQIDSFDSTQDGEGNYLGLTKREHFAAMSMANLADKATNFYEFDVYAEMAVKIADALIKALNQSHNDN